MLFSFRGKVKSGLLGDKSSTLYFVRIELFL